MLLKKKYKVDRILILSLLFALLPFNLSYSQCGCMGGAAVGGLTPVTGTTNIGVLRKGYSRVTTYYTYSYGNDYFSQDTKTGIGLVKEFYTSYLGLNLAYGISEDVTAEAELHYFINKTQDFQLYKLSSYGMSHIALYLKYNIISKIVNEIEWSVGLGGKIPTQSGSGNFPQHIQSSTGDFGIILQSFLHKGIKSEGLHFILANRLENNFENKNEYQYGISIINSIFITKLMMKDVTGIIELRSDIRMKDKLYGDYLDDTGSNTIALAPQIAYSINDLNLSILFDYPIYKYYNGNQLTKDYSIGAAITWQTDLFKFD
jgi:hypothetical protein